MTRARLVSALLLGCAVVLGCGQRLEPAREAAGVQSHEADVLAQFALNEETPRPSATSTYRLIQGPSQLLHPDPLVLSRVEIDFATSLRGLGLSTQIASAFRNDGYRGMLDVSVVDDERMFDGLCAHEVALALTVRRPEIAEVRKCHDADDSLMVWPVALDRVVAVAHPDNFWIGRISASQLALVLEGEWWSDIDPTWPQRPLQKYLPDADSPEMSLLVEAAQRQVETADAHDLPSATYGLVAADRLRSLAADPEGISFVTVGEARRNTLGSIERSLSILDPLHPGVYPVEHTLYLATSTSILTQSPEVAAFVAYFLNRIDLDAQGQYLVGHQQLPTTRSAFAELTTQLGLMDGPSPLVSVEDAA